MLQAILIQTLFLFTVYISGWVPVPDFVGIGEVTENSFELTWSPVANATGYEVSYAPFVSASQFSIVKVDAKKRSHKFTTLNPCTAYYGKVRALIGQEKSAWLDLRVYTGAGTPAAIEKVTFATTILTIVDNSIRPECGDYIYIIKVFNREGNEMEKYQTRLANFNVPYLFDKYMYGFRVYVKDLYTGLISVPMLVAGEASGIKKYNLPPSGIAIEKITMSSIELSWTPIESTKVTLLVVQANAFKSAGPEVEFDGGLGKYEKLKACTKYVVYLKVKGGYWSEEIPFITLGDDSEVKPSIAVTAERIYSRNALIKIDNTGTSPWCTQIGYKIDVSQDGVSIFQTTIKSSEIMLTNLKAETRYNCIVTPINLQSLKEIKDYSKSVDFTTKKEEHTYDVAVVGLKLNTASVNYAIISWIPPYPKPFAYVISLMHPNMNTEHFITEESGYLLNDLVPCTSYIVNVRPIQGGDVANVGRETNDLKFITLQPNVKPPTNVLITLLKGSPEFKYTIIDPFEETCGSKRYWYALYDDFTKEKLVENVVSTKTGTIPVKKYPTRYFMTVYAFVNDPKNRSPEVKSNYHTEYPLVLLDIVKGLTLVNVQTNSFKIKWNAPATATHYILSLLKDGVFIEKVTVTTTEYTFTRLEKCQKYDVIVRATDFINYSDVAVIWNIETLETIPLPVKSAKLQPFTEKMLYLTIDDFAISRCSKPTYEVTIYQIDKTTPIRVMETVHLKTGIDNLNPETSYYVTVAVKGKSIGFISNNVISNSAYTLRKGSSSRLPIQNFTYKPNYFIKFPLLSPKGSMFIINKQDLFSSNSPIDYCQTIENFLEKGKLTVLECDLVKVDSISSLTVRLTFGSEDRFVSLGRVKYAAFKGMKAYSAKEINDFGFKIDHTNIVMSKEFI